MEPTMSIPAESQSGSEPVSLSKVVSRIAHVLNEQRIGTGDLAAIRRISYPDLPPAFWKLYLGQNGVPREWREHRHQPSEQLDWAWASLVRAMVAMAPGPHAPRISFASELAASGYSEARFVRLLRAADQDLARELRTAASWLASKGIPRVDWVPPAQLLLGRIGIRGMDAQRTIHRLARDYFRRADH